VKGCYILMKRNDIVTDKAPVAIGPYAQGVRYGEWLFVSGQIPINPQTGLIDDNVAAQAAQALTNLGAVLAAAGASFDDVVKTTVFISNMDDFAVINQEYAACFKTSLPARSCVQVARLPKDVKLEIEAIAFVSDKQ